MDEQRLAGVTALRDVQGPVAAGRETWPRLGAPRQNCAWTMSEPNLKSELEALKAQIAEMSRRAVAKDPPGPDADSSKASTLDEVRKLADRVDTSQLAEQALEYLKGVGQDVQESKPRALVAAFLAGFLAGRATGR